jgi:hypothetical protein
VAAAHRAVRRAGHLLKVPPAEQLRVQLFLFDRLTSQNGPT